MVFMDTICLSSIADALIDAAYLFGYRQRRSSHPLSESKLAAAKEAYAFVSGTGLDMVIRYYQMELDPDELRSKFMNIWKQK